MLKWLPLVYRDFYDVPRVFVVEGDAAAYVFWSPFDEEEDEYRPRFCVYRISRLDSVAPPEWVWSDPPSSGPRVGQIDVTDVVFDPTRRRFVASSVLEQLGLAQHVPPDRGDYYSEVQANRDGNLPVQNYGYYTDADVWPGPGPRGSERVIVGGNGESWYTPDHYGTFRPWLP